VFSTRVSKTVSLKADRTTVQRPRSLDDWAVALHLPRTCLITTAHRKLALINRLPHTVRLHSLTTCTVHAVRFQRFLYASPFVKSCMLWVKNDPG